MNAMLLIGRCILGGYFIYTGIHHCTHFAIPSPWPLSLTF
jgi:hypothetical protein